MNRALVADARGQSLPAATTSDDSGPGHTAWARNDLVRRVCVALSIAKRVIAVLGEHGYRDEDKLDESFGPDKPCAETAMLLHVASGVTGAPDVTASIAELATLLAPRAVAPHRLCHRAAPDDLPAAGHASMPHVLLNALGLPDARFDRVLALGRSSRRSQPA